MVWLRKGIVHLLAVVLLVSLLGMALSASINHDFAHPNKLETWLSESNIYGQIIPNAINNAQVENSQDGSEGSISLDDPGVKQAAIEAFPAGLLQQSVNTVINSNYAWLEGKATTPNFKIDLLGPKQSFANSIGQLVQNHLSTVPICSDTQITQLQLPVDPLTVPCRPPTLDAKTEGSQVAKAVNSGDFLNKPVITAANLGQGQTYYQKVPKAPQFFRLELKLPYILAALSLILTLCVLAIAPTRRQGLRRVGATLLLAGIILAADKLVADEVVKKVEGRAFTHSLNGQLQQPYYDLLNKIESSLTKGQLYFGVAFVLLAIVIFVYLIFSRSRAANKQVPRPSEPTAADVDTPEVTAKPSVDGRVPKLRPSALDGMGPRRQSQLPSPAQPPAATAPQLRPQQPRPPKRPRLIQ